MNFDGVAISAKSSRLRYTPSLSLLHSSIANHSIASLVNSSMATMSLLLSSHISPFSPLSSTTTHIRAASPRRPLLAGIKPNPTSQLKSRLVSLGSMNDSFGCRFGRVPSLSVNGRRRRSGAVCYAAPLSAETLMWVSAISIAVLMLTKGTAIQKSFLVPLFALQAPIGVISWIKGEYGTWTAFLALLVRLFYFIPGELDLPFLTMLLVIVAPFQVINLRGTQAGGIISLAIAGYSAFQHFSRAGSLQRAFSEGSIVATLAIICIIVAACMFLF